jgi:two-component system, LytTR family, sensor kinase
MSYLRGALTRHSWWLAVAWVAVGVITATQVVVGLAALGEHHNWATLFFTTAACWLIWVAATPVILRLSRRFPLMGAGNWRNIPVHVAAALVISFVRIAWSAALEWAVNPLDVEPHAHYRGVFLVMVYMQFHTGFIIYAATVAIDNIVDYVRRLARGEAESARLAGELSKAQFEALRRQLEPHFLFNTLNGIAGLVREKQNDAAVEMIAGLSALLRRVLEDSGSQLVPLAEEVSFLGSYIDLQSMRLGERLKVTVDIPRELYGAMVPQLLLQPLVENAIVHGIAKLVEGGHIRVHAQEAEGILSISIYNDGPTRSAGNADEKAGVGLLNTRRRLVALYGTGSSVELRPCQQVGVETIIQLPYRTAA